MVSPREAEAELLALSLPLRLEVVVIGRIRAPTTGEISSMESLLGSISKATERLERPRVTVSPSLALVTI